MQIEVVDDCSTDDPQTIIDELAPGRIRFHRQPENVGQSDNLNTCIEHARGQLVHILHGDDTVRDGFYRTMEQPFHDHPEIGAAFCRHIYVDPSGHERDRRAPAACGRRLARRRLPTPDGGGHPAAGGRGQAVDVCERRRVRRTGLGHAGPGDVDANRRVVPALVRGCPACALSPQARLDHCEVCVDGSDNTRLSGRSSGCCFGTSTPSAATRRTGSPVAEVRTGPSPRHVNSQEPETAAPLWFRFAKHSFRTGVTPRLVRRNCFFAESVEEHRASSHPLERLPCSSGLQ